MSSRQLWIALLLAGYSVMSYVDRTLLSVAAPSIIKEFAISETEMGVVFSAFQLSYMLMMTPGGRWADRFGARLVLTIMGVGAGLFTALMPAGPILGKLIGFIPAMVLLRLGFGVFTAPLYPSTGRVNANMIPVEKRTFVQSIINSGAGLGGALSPLLFTWMMVAFGWRRSFILAGVCTVALALVWNATMRETAASRAEASAVPDWGKLLRNRNLQLLTLGFAAVDYFEYIFFYWLYYYLGEIRKVPADEMAVWASMPFVAWVVMMPMGGLLADWAASRFGLRKGYRGVAVFSMAVSVAALVGALQMDGIGATITLLSLAFGSVAIADVVFWAGTIAIAGRQVGAAGGIMNTGGNFGGGLAPIVTPMVAARYGWSAGLYLGAAVAVIALVCWLFIDPEQPNPSEGVRPFSS